MNAAILVRRLRTDGCPRQAEVITQLMIRIAELEGASDPVARVEAEIEAATWTGQRAGGRDE